MAVETESRVTDNPGQQRYELWLGDRRAGLIQYLTEPGTVLLVHTEIDPAFAGQGLGDRLVAGASATSAPAGSSWSPSARSSAPTCAATLGTPTWSSTTRPSPSSHGLPSR